MAASELSSPILSYAKALHAQTQPATTSFDDYLRHLTSSECDALKPLVLDASHPISNYYISSSHNTYLSGNQLYGHASTAPYQHVLENGCRCVEIDVWNGESPPSSEDEGDGEGSKIKSLRSRIGKNLHLHHHDSEEHQHQTPESHESKPADTYPDGRIKPWRVARCEPRVLHGHTATKEVSFRSVCEAIAITAFKTSDMPIIVSLEIHTDREQQQMMVDIMRECWGPYLVDSYVNFDDQVALPSLESLRKKILIKVKHSPAKPHRAKIASHGADSSEDEQIVEAVKKGKIIEALGSMGTYTRACHFKSFSQPEAKIPTHVFALSEGKLVDVHKDDPTALFRHNKTYLMRAYPKGLRVSSSNLDPAPLWRQGVQMVALNWQYVNAANMLGMAMFQGTPGWVLKPSHYRDPAATSSVSSPRGTLNLTLELFAAQSLPLASHTMRPHIRCDLHVDQIFSKSDTTNVDAILAKDGEFKAHSSNGNSSQDPDFKRQKLVFKDIQGITEELSFVRIKVVNDDSMMKDELLAWACFRLDRLGEGIRMMHLYDADSRPCKGRIMVRVEKSFVLDK